MPVIRPNDEGIQHNPFLFYLKHKTIGDDQLIVIII